MRPLPLALYTSVSYTLQPVANYILSKRLKRGKEDKNRIDERRGKSHLSWRQYPVIWVHAASVGESLSSLTLINALAKKYPNFRFVVTTGTTSSAKIMGKNLPEVAIHQYFPIDYPIWVSRFLDNWQPKAAIFIESEFWPNFLQVIKKRNIPAFLVNGRISDKSLTNWQRTPKSIKYMLSAFKECYGQSVVDTQRLSTLGAKNSAYLGNLKFVPLNNIIPKYPPSPLMGRKRWLYASTHEGEEEIAANIHLRLLKEIPDIHTCIMPRHAERSDAIETMLLEKGLIVTRKSRGEQPIEGGIFLFDIMGHATEFYTLGGPTLMGRSFAKGGGQNPIEPARAGNIIILGPDMNNFKHITEMMLNQNIAEQVVTPDELYGRLHYWLTNREQANSKSQATQNWANALGNGILERYLRQLAPYLDKVK